MAKRKRVKITARGHHAIAAMAEIAQQERDAPVPLSQIAKAGNISLSYLEQLFAGLRRHGLVKSFRGPGGGYRLTRPAAEISVADILISAEDLPSVKERESDDKSFSGNERIGAFWGMIDEVLYACLSKVSLADVTEGKVADLPFVNNLFETLG